MWPIGATARDYDAIALPVGQPALAEDFKGFLRSE